MTAAALVLPVTLVTRLDMAQLVIEVEQLDNHLVTEAAREKVGAEHSSTPSYSELLRTFLEQNQLEIGDSQQRTELIGQLRRLKDTAPTVHVTFATTADQESLQKIVAWLRQTVHEQALLSVGLQPSLVGGVYVRTPNHVHDLSVRAQLANKRYLIVEQVKQLTQERQHV